MVGGAGHDVIILVSALGSATSMYSSGSFFGPVVSAQACRSSVWDGGGRIGCDPLALDWIRYNGCCSSSFGLLITMMWGGKFPMSSSVRELVDVSGVYISSFSRESSVLIPVTSDASPYLTEVSSDPLLDQKFSAGMGGMRKVSSVFGGVGKGEDLLTCCWACGS